MSAVVDAAKNVFLTVRGRPAPRRTIRGHKSEVEAVAFFKDSQRVVTCSKDTTLRIWDVQKGALIGGSFEGHKDWVRSVAVSPDDRRMVSGGRDKRIIMWDVESKQMIFEPLVKHTHWVESVCFSPDGKRFASGSQDFTVVVWNAETGAVITTLDGHRGSVWSVAFSPDGLKLASGSSDYSIRVWNAVNPELLFEIDAHKNPVRSVVWSSDGQQLVSASYGSVMFWNSSNGDQNGLTCTGHTDWIRSLDISSDNSFIAAASDDKTVRLWSTKTHRNIGQALEHLAGLLCVAISPDGKWLVSGDNEGRVWFWFLKNILKQYEAEVEQQRQLANRTSKTLSTHLIQPSDRDSIIKISSETPEISSTQSRSSEFDFLAINTTIRDAGYFHTPEELLVQEIDADNNNSDSYANRSIVRARIFDWDNALQDAVKSISIQPSLMGYISKGIALCGNDQVLDAMEAFDLAFVFSNRDPMNIDLLLLIKAVALFNAGRHDEAMRRVEDLATACQQLDTLPCRVVEAYLLVQLATIDFQGEQYIEAADQLTANIDTITRLFLHAALLEPRCKIFTLLFGWDFDSFWQTVNQRRCDAFLRAGRLTEAVESHQYMMSRIDDAAKDSCLEWSTAFKQDCAARCVAKAHMDVSASNHEMAVKLYSAAIEMDSSSHYLFTHRSRAKLGLGLYADALHDAEKVIELNPSSHVGYKLQHAALHEAQRYDEAVVAFKTMLSKLENASDPQTQKLRQQYVSPPEVEDAVRKTVHSHLESAPLRLVNTSTGRLCDRQAQTNTFKTSTEYKKLLSSSIKHPHLQMESIEEAVEMYFRWVMLSHRWENEEPRLPDIEDKVVYDLDPIGTVVKNVVKLQTFCKLACNAGYLWAWSDTCCIDQNNNVELQRSVNSMFVWYRRSALTIIYLSDVPPLSTSGALAASAWNTRGWTVQEFLAPAVVLFYQADWTLYLNDHSPNHKESVAIMQELEDSTGIDAQTLVAFSPGMTGAREKLRWASTRATTLQEDIAYSLFGIFGLHQNVIYGEGKQHALGRLLQEIVAQSGDITALDWVGKSSEFHSCLPADISAYNLPPSTPPFLSEDQIQTSVSSLQNAIVVKLASTLYARLGDLTAPRFMTRRLHLHCIAFPVTEVRGGRGQDRETHLTYEIKAEGLQDMLITTEDRLTQFSRTRSPRQRYLLVRPWNRYDLELPDLADDPQNVDDLSDSESLSDGSYNGSPRDNEPVDSESHLRALRLVVRLGQPFGALLLVQQRGGEYKRIASDHNINAQVKDMAAVHDMMDVRTLEIL